MTTAIPEHSTIPAPSGPRFSLADVVWRYISGWIGIIVIFAIWEIVGRVKGAAWLPPVSEVITRLGELFANNVIQPNLIASFRSLGIGFGISLVFGLVIGVAMGLSSKIFIALDMYVNAMLFVPALAFAPILFAAFGLADTTRVAIVIMYALFIIIINTAAGIRDIDDPLLDMAASFGATRWTTIRRVILPAAVPLIIAGIRLSVGRAVKGMVNGEMFIALVGLGGLAIKFGNQRDFEGVWAMALFIVIIAVILNQIVSAIERRLTAWYS